MSTSWSSSRETVNISSAFARAYKGDLSALQLGMELAERLPRSKDRTTLLRAMRRAVSLAEADDSRVHQLINMLPEESLLKLDIAITSPATADRLLVGISSKWSLRTDRAQDCVAQGAKLVNLRRGHMPHYAVLTMEPRPSMLRILAYGSGSLDCVYHLALDELQQAATALATKRNKAEWEPRMLLERMVLQGRIRPYQALVEEIERFPG